MIGVSTGVSDEAGVLPLEATADSLAEDARTEEGRSAAAAVSDAAPAEPARATARLFGRVVREDGLPLEGVAVRVYAPNEPWLSEELAEPEDPAPYTTATLADGTFERVVPLPTARSIHLELKAGDFLGRVDRALGKRDQRPLHPGDNDLGRFVLLDAGVIEGEVRDAHGSPLKGARVSLGSPTPHSGWRVVRGGLPRTGYITSAETDAEGRFRIPNVPAGPYGVQANAEGYLLGESVAIVLDAETTERVTFALDRGPRLSGRVIDEEGAPLAGVRLEALSWSEGVGVPASARSQGDGTFVLRLQTDVPLELVASLEGYSRHEQPGVTHVPGATDVEIVLRRAARTTFLVLRADGTPVERFGLKLIRVRQPSGHANYDTRHQWLAAIESHPGGRVVLAGEPALHDYTIVAPGFAPQRGRVATGARDEPHQTIVLEPEAVLGGRLLHDSVPVAEPAVKIQRDVVDSPSEGDESPLVDYGIHTIGTYDLDEVVGRKRVLQGRADGTFRIDGLATGTYRLELNAPGLAPLSIRRLRLVAGEHRDLGDLAAALAGELRGVVILPEALSPAGVRLSVGNAFFPEPSSTLTLEASGTFRFGGLAAGRHFLHVGDKHGVVMNPKPFLFEIGPGESRRIEVDLAPYAACFAEIRVLLGGVPASGVHVEWIGKGQDRIGTTDERGLCRGPIPSGRPIGFRAESQRGLPLATLEPMTPEPGDLVRLDLEGTTPGTLELTLPITLDIDARHGNLRIRALDPDADADADAVGRIAAVLHDEPWTEEAGLWRLDLGPVAPGPYRVEFRTNGELWSARTAVMSGTISTCHLEPAAEER